MMKFEIEIMPTFNNHELTWQQLKEQIIEYADDKKGHIINLGLVDLEGDDVDLSNIIQIDKFYGFRSNIVKTLSVMLLTKDSNVADDDDECIVDDYGSGLSLSEREELLSKFKKLSYTIPITAESTRTSEENELIGCIVAGIAKAYEAKIVILAGKPSGSHAKMYNPEEFALLF